MARIVLDKETLVQRSLLGLTSQVNAGAQLAGRALRIMNEISNSGAAPLELETSPESLLPAGKGAQLYAAATEIKTRLDALVLILAAIDQG